MQSRDITTATNYKRRWTREDEVTLINLAAKGVAIDRIAITLKRNEGAIRSHLYKMKRENKLPDPSIEIVPKKRGKSAGGYSMVALRWLAQISDRFKIIIRHAENGGEHMIMLTDNEKKSYIHKYVMLDGFAIINKKEFAFEFDGCYWHGCLKCYEPTEMNSICKKTMAELNKKTILKSEIVKNHGYVLTSIKECDYKKINKSDTLSRTYYEKLEKLFQ